MKIEKKDDDANVDDDDDFNPEDFVSNINPYCSDYDNIDINNFENDDNDPVRFPISTFPTDRTQKNLDKIIGNNLLSRNVALVSESLPNMIMEQKEFLIQERTTNQKQLKEWIKDINTHNSFPIDEEEIHYGNHNEQIRQTRVKELSHALMPENCEWKGSRLQSSNNLNQVPQLKNQAFISDISFVYNLNKLQHVAFELIATTLLKGWMNREMYRIDEENRKINLQQIDSVELSNQLCMVLVGEGGTGKSRVINAVDALCLSWGRQHSLIKAAPTGKAAVLISGQTLASVVIRLRHSKANIFSCTISCLIVDEMSMITLRDLYELDVQLRRITGIKMKFGGLSIILCGDFLQLPPAGGKPLYKKPLNHITQIEEEISNEDLEKGRKHFEKYAREHPELVISSPKDTPTKKGKIQKPPYADEIVAYDLWMNHFTTVVYLEENMRFLKDPEWGNELADARKGLWSKRLIEIINDRHLVTTEIIELNNKDIHSFLIDQVVSLPDSSKSQTMSKTVFATPSNASKQAINHTFTKAFSSSMPDNMLPIRVVADFWGQLSTYSERDKAYIMGLDESKFGRLAPFLDLVIGMPIMVTQNVEPRKGIANGTFGILEDIQFPRDTLFRKVYDTVLDIEVLVPSKLPILAWIRTNRGEGAIAPPVNGEESLQNRSDIFPVFPCQPFRAAAPIKLKTRDSSVINLKITQLPIIPCTASTAYKLQGETLESEVIVDWKSEVSIINKRQQAYLMLSRCTTREALITLHRFTEDLAKWFKPDKDVLEEDNRLKQLHNKLISERNNTDTTNNSKISNDEKIDSLIISTTVNDNKRNHCSQPNKLMSETNNIDTINDSDISKKNNVESVNENNSVNDKNSNYCSNSDKIVNINTENIKRQRKYY